MSLLDRKLVRDMLVMKGQVATIALVIGAGIAVFVASVSTYRSLESGRDRFYDATRFPDVFAGVKRAPLSLLPRLAEVGGVAQLEARIVRDAIVDWPSAPMPVSARLVSISHGGDEPLARLHMVRGSAPAPNDSHGAVVNEAFARANGAGPGSEIRILLNGRVQNFIILGTALSPEYVYSVKPGLPIPDDRFYAVLWIDRSAAEAAFDMKGAFNDLAVSLASGAEPDAVVEALDRILGPYGSIGAIKRRDQPSNRFLEDELDQQRVMGLVVPSVFFGIAAFLLNAALARQVAAQREQIASLRALGFPTPRLMLHYLKFAAVIILLGTLFGTLGGIGFGRAMMSSYRGFFQLPELEFRIAWWSVPLGASISFLAAGAGILSALRAVVAIAPAIAMRPVAPLSFRRSGVEMLFAAFLSASRKMVWRNLAGRPLRTGATVLGLSLSVPLVVLGLFWRDSVDEMIRIQFDRIERGNVMVTFPHPADRRILNDLRREPGVIEAEGIRFLPVRLRAGARSYLTSAIGLEAGSVLRRPVDKTGQAIVVAPDGVTLTSALARRLDLSIGDRLSIEVLEGRRRIQDLPVAAIADETIGMSVYVDAATLSRLTDEGSAISGAALFVDPSALPVLMTRLKSLPTIESVSMKSATLAAFFDKIAGMILIAGGILTIFGVIIAVGVVYNSLRIGAQERGWELASLRVLGFSRAEAAAIFFSEFAIEVLIAIPIGMALAPATVDLIARFHSNESFQVPAVVGARTLAAAALVVIVAAASSAYVIRRQIDRLDLVSVLKARD